MNSLAAHAAKDFIARIPRDFAREHLLLGVFAEDSGPRLLCSAATPGWVLHNTQLFLGVAWPCEPIEDTSQLATWIDQAYEHAAPTAGGAGLDTNNESASSLPVAAVPLDVLLSHAQRDLLATAGKAPMVRLVDGLLFHAVQSGASDLHLQPLPDRIVIRHRIDGVLDQGRDLPIALLRPIVSRIKVMAGMDVAEHLLPQDGRTTVDIGSRKCDIRVSTLPTPHGERVVLRLLDASRHLQVFSDLGMPDSLARTYLAAARRTSGIILVTGPTGSGKTTTLYASLRELDSRERNIMTIEDPIEYELDTLGLPISQSQVNARKGVTFANGLRHLLRQDPDIILVGEIRDAETARVAIQSSLTGHLVLSTLHTNDAPSAVTRLLDLGVEPYLVAASLSVVIAQRLVRTVCPTCHNEESMRTGCAMCGGSGYRGRRGIFELLAIDDDLRHLISNGVSLQQLRQAAIARGMPTLQESGAALVEAGHTTPFEVERVVHG